MLGVPTYFLNIEYVLNNLNALDVPSRCTIIIFKNLKETQIAGEITPKLFSFPTFISPDALQVIERITEILKRIPEFALIITSESAEVFPSSLSSQHIPWFITKAGSNVVTAGMCHVLHVITVTTS